MEVARRYPHLHIQRWQSLEPIAGVSDEVIADVAIPLLRSGDNSEVILGVQLLDPATFDGVIRPQRHAELAGLLDEVCRPGCDPDVIAAALGVWSDGNPEADNRLADFLTHPSPTVRARAGFLYAMQPSVPARQRLSRLTELLEDKRDAVVREQVADGLWRMLQDALSGDPDEGLDPDPELARDATDCLRRRRDDSSPAVRAIVFNVLSRTDAAPDLRWLLAELADPDVHPGFVSAVTPRIIDRRAPGMKDTDIAVALKRLRESRWAERVADGGYPGPVERRQALDGAIETADRSR